MNAQEAKEKAAQNRIILAENQFKKCLEEIEKAVSRGNTHTEIYDEGSFYASTNQKLKDLGYQVKGTRILWEYSTLPILCQ